MRPLRTVPHKLQHILRVAHLDRVRPEALVLPRDVAPLAGALAGTTIPLLNRPGDGSAKRQREPVLRQIRAGCPRRTGAYELPLSEDVADLDAGFGRVGGAAVGAELACGCRRRGGRRAGRGGQSRGGCCCGEGEDGCCLHFCFLFSFFVSLRDGLIGSWGV